MIIDHVKGKTFVDFVASHVLQDAVIRRLGIVGEATKGLSAKTREKYPAIAWRDMGRLRDLVVHHYWKLDLAEIWGIAKKDVPTLLKTLK